jgi:hypothetical protein
MLHKEKKTKKMAMSKIEVRVRKEQVKQLLVWKREVTVVPCR